MVVISLVISLSSSPCLGLFVSVPRLGGVVSPHGVVKCQGVDLDIKRTHKHSYF